MEPRHDDELGDLVEADLDVGGRRDVLGCIDHPTLKRSVDVCRRERRRARADRVQYLGPGSGRADFHSLEVIEVLDPFVGMQEELG